MVKSDPQTLLFKKSHPNAQLPMVQTLGAAGFDWHTPIAFTIKPGEILKVDIGLRVTFIPPGYEIMIRPRSGLAFKYGITILNSPGNLDNDYRGEVGVLLINHGPNAVPFEVGDRIAQGVPTKMTPLRLGFSTKEQETTTERGDGGFGSTGV